MADTTRESAESRSVSEAWNAITAFEQILEIMPNDVSTLDALVRSCEMVGDTERARKYIVRLVRTHLTQRNAAQAEALAEDLRRLGAGSAEAEELLRQLEGTRRRPAFAPAAEIAPTAETSALEAELSLAWRLHEAELLTQQDYAAVANDLTTLAAQPDAVRISLLHVLSARAFPNLDGLLAHMAREARVPVINVAAFDPPRACRTLLPLDFMARRCVLPFEMIGREALVALLNPFDDSLREQVRRRVGAPCHFYLTRPANFDDALERWA
mgnify:CR=1 FL=1